MDDITKLQQYYGANGLKVNYSFGLYNKSDDRFELIHNDAKMIFRGQEIKYFKSFLERIFKEVK